MKTTLTTACFTALLILGNLTSAQTTTLDNALADPNLADPPATTKMRVENLKTRHTESLSTLTADINRIPSDPSLITAKETFAAIDRADRAMKRSKSACDAILAALRSELAAIKAETVFTDDQKTELEASAKAMADECITVRKQSEVVIKNLATAYKALAQAKKVYKSYLNLQGESQAKVQLRAAVGVYVKSLTQSPAEAQRTTVDGDESESVQQNGKQ